MDVLIRWHPTALYWSPDRAYHRYEGVEAMTCDGRMVDRRSPAQDLQPPPGLDRGVSGASTRACEPAHSRGTARGLGASIAAQAIQASTDPALLYKMIRVEGFRKFRELARKEFNREVGIKFTSTELLAIFEYLDHQITLQQLAYRRNPS